MAIFDGTNIKDIRRFLSQTPPNYVQENYYLKELQQKVNADWRFRPNRADIEIERDFGQENFEPIQVVLQSIKNDKGESVSKDWWRIVFRDIQKKYPIGQRYRFSDDFDINLPKEYKNVYIGLNQDIGNFTSAQVACRCNGTLGSIYTDENGKNIYHYEPVIQTTKFNSAGFQFSEVAIDPRGQLTIIAQHNKYTRQWYINQRFVIGYDRVYKVANILKNDSQLTYDPEDVGIIRVYLDMDQIGELDDFNTRIAYNGIKPDPVQPAKEDEYTLSIADPLNIPEILTELRFKPHVMLNGMEQDANIEVQYSLVGPYADKANLNDLVDQSGPDEDGYYTLLRKKQDPALKLNVKCITDVNGSNLEINFVMKLLGQNYGG